MAKTFFERVEKKYIIDSVQFDNIIKYINDRCIPDEYPDSDIFNIYYDNDTHRIIRDSLEKPNYKEKLRMRAYQVPNDNTGVFIEIKKKVHGVVYKRRVHMTYRDAVNYLEKGMPPPNPSQMTKEIDYFIKCYDGVKPSMFISYHRLSFIGKDDDSLRITFDDNVLCRETELALSKGNCGTPLLKDGIRLMEIKTVGSMPLWLAHALDEYRIFPGTFSKYGTAYLNSLLN